MIVTSSGRWAGEVPSSVLAAKSRPGAGCREGAEAQPPAQARMCQPRAVSWPSSANGSGARDCHIACTPAPN